MLEKLKQVLQLWNPFREKLYVYYESFREEGYETTIVKSTTKFEAAYNSPGREYYVGKYLDVEELPDRKQLEGSSSLKEKLSRRIFP